MSRALKALNAPTLFVAALLALVSAVVWTGGRATAAPFEVKSKWTNTTNVTASTNEANPSMTPGTCFFDEDTGRTYMYIQFDNGAGDVAITAGDPAFVKTLATFVVTGDISDSITGQAGSVCGIFVAALTDQYYGLIQVLGPYPTVTTNNDDDASPGDTLIADADVVCNTVASGTASTTRALGYATASAVDADNTVAAWITVGIW